MISNLQALRGLAALAVVFYHTAFTFNGGVHTEFMAIAVFFVISGFIMTYITRDNGDAKYFLTQRLIRIVPMYWLSTLVLIVLTAIVHSGHTWDNLSPGSLAKSLFFVSYWNSSGEHEPLLAVGWTLNIEMFFYLLFTAMLAASRRWAPVLVCIALLAIMAAVRLSECSATVCTLYVSGYFSYFIAGIVAYYVWCALDGYARNRPRLVAPFAAVLVLGFALVSAHPPLAVFLQSRLSFPMSLMPPLLVVTLLLLHSANFRVTWAPAIILGDASYVLYLTHIIVMPAIIKSLGWFIAFDPKQNVYAMVSMLIICSAVAILAHYRIERPVLRILHQKFARKPAIAQA
ncbi:MAG TPA: acyltransferase [Gallionellaceae bacterium]